MKHAFPIRGVAAFVLATLAWTLVASAGDSLYGKVIAVESADKVVFDYGAGRYELKLVGIEVPRDTLAATDARKFVTDLVLNKNVRMRFEGRDPDGTMRARLFTDDPQRGIQEVNVELVRAGLVQPGPGGEYKYDELRKAEGEAKAARRGLWSTTQPQ